MKYRITMMVALGSGLGGVTRVLLNWASERWISSEFPYGTLAANVLGSLVIGFAAGLLESGHRGFFGSYHHHFLMTGFCGGFTTFSFFSVQTLGLLEQQRPLLALSYAALTVGLSLTSVWAGYRLGHRNGTPAAGPTQSG